MSCMLTVVCTTREALHCFLSLSRMTAAGCLKVSTLCIAHTHTHRHTDTHCSFTCVNALVTAAICPSIGTSATRGEQDVVGRLIVSLQTTLIPDCGSGFTDQTSNYLKTLALAVVRVQVFSERLCFLQGLCSIRVPVNDIVCSKVEAEVTTNSAVLLRSWEIAFWVDVQMSS